jgi:hypothetical protein
MYFTIITFFYIFLGSIFINAYYMVLFLFNTVVYVFLLLYLCIIIIIIIVCLCIFIVPAGTLPWLRFFRDFSSVVRQMPGYNP